MGSQVSPAPHMRGEILDRIIDGFTDERSAEDQGDQMNLAMNADDAEQGCADTESDRQQSKHQWAYRAKHPVQKKSMPSNEPAPIR